MGKYVLHDLATRAPQSCWSLNPWKTRLLLNFKGLDYETNWVEYPDIASLLKDHAPENEITPTTKKPYTLPAVTFPDGTWIQDSKKIAVEIEKQHPQPSANLESPYQARIEDLLPKCFGPLMPILFNQVPKNLLNEPGVKYWVQDRGSRVGTFDLEAYEKEHGGEAAYEKARPALDEITDMLKEKEGPFFEGKTVSYADFVWLGALLCLKRVNPKDYEGAIGKSKDRSVHDGLIEACAEWTKRNDH